MIAHDAAVTSVSITHEGPMDYKKIEVNEKSSIFYLFKMMDFAFKMMNFGRRGSATC